MNLTSTYFEGQAESNPQAKRGYSRDKRPDCKQVLVGLVLDRDGFPKAHEVFDGNRQDRTTVGEMLDSLEKRTGSKAGATVVVDRGMAYEEDLAAIAGAWISLSCGGPAAGTKCVARRVRAERRLGRGDPSAFAAQSRSGEITVRIKRRQQGRRFTFSA